jgi:hypothetical protein
MFRTIALLSLLFITLSAVAASRDDAAAQRIKKAKDAYAATVESARKRLAEEYDSVIAGYTRTGNLDAALATRKSRDQFLAAATQPSFGDPYTPDVEDGWTILFRADEPLIWNLPVRNKTMYSVPLSAAGKDIQYVRLRRMDTRDYVILQTSVINSRVWPTASPYFRGDKCMDRQSCCLGIADPKHMIDSNQCASLDNTPNGSLGGYGFGQWNTGASRQGYLWASKPIDRTSFEISTTSRPLAPEEQSHLLTP